MARKILKKLLPDPSRFRENKSLGFLGTALHQPGLWHLNRHSAAKAVAIGFFVANLPIPMQMIVAAILAVRFNATLPLSVVLVWITNPVTIPFIFFFNYVVGSLLLQQPLAFKDFHFSYDWVMSQIEIIWLPMLLGSVLMGAISAAIGYFAMSGFWHWRVRKDWERRQKRRAARKLAN